MFAVTRASAQKALCLDFRIAQVGMQGFVGNGSKEVLVDGRVEFSRSTFRKVLEVVVLEGTAFPRRGEDVVGIPV